MAVVIVRSIQATSTAMSVEHLHRLASPFTRNCILAASILDAWSRMAISNAVLLPDHHKNLYAIVRDRKLYYRMRAVGCTFLRILLFTFSASPFLLSFRCDGKTEGISIKYIKPIPKKGRVCRQRREISGFVQARAFAALV